MMTLVNKYKNARFDLAKTYMEFEEDYMNDEVTNAEERFLSAEQNLIRIATHPYGPVEAMGYQIGTFDQIMSNQIRKAQVLDFVLQNW